MNRRLRLRLGPPRAKLPNLVSLHITADAGWFRLLPEPEQGRFPPDPEPPFAASPRPIRRWESQLGQE